MLRLARDGVSAERPGDRTHTQGVEDNCLSRCCLLARNDRIDVTLYKVPEGYALQGFRISWKIGAIGFHLYSNMSAGAFFAFLAVLAVSFEMTVTAAVLGAVAFVVIGHGA
jgi:hypothetical protein